MRLLFPLRALLVSSFIRCARPPAAVHSFGRRGSNVSEIPTGEKRRHPRIIVSINVDWGFTTDCEQHARLTSISAGGCFMQTPDEVRPDEQIFIRLCLPETHLLRGEVRYHMPAVGFGLKFIGLTIEDQLMLEALIASYGK